LVKYNIKFIICSSKVIDAEMAKMKGSEFDEYFEKPLNVQKVSKVMDSVLEQINKENLE